MAHTILLPTQFEFKIWPMKWFLAKLSLDSWRYLSRRSKRRGLIASVLEPSQFRGESYEVRGGAIPMDVWQRALPAGRRLPVELRRFNFDAFLYLPPGKGERTKTIDPWQARDEFLSLRSTTELLAFLNKYGTWNEFLRSMWFVLSDRPKNPRIAYPEDFWAERDELRRALIQGVRNDWTGSKLDFAWASDFPHYVHVDNDCLKAIRTATTIDFLKNVRFKICARKDCGKPFPAERKGKRYCQQYCAHLVSLRKKRNQEAQEKANLKNNLK